MKNIFLLLLALVSINLFSQDPKLSENFIVKTGEEYKETDGIFKQFYKYKDYVVAINSQKKDLVIQKFDPISLKEIKRVDLKSFMKKFKTNFELVQMDNKVIFFYEVWDRKEKIETLMAVNISLESLSVSEPYTVLTQKGIIAVDPFRNTQPKSYKYASTIVIGRNIFGSKYFFHKSRDDQKLLITYRMYPEKRKDTESYDNVSINIFNTDLTLDWKTMVKMPYTERRMDNVDDAIDNFGNYYLITKVFEDDSYNEKKKTEKKANYHLELFKIKRESSEILKTKIEIGDSFIGKIALYNNGIGDMILAGTCKNSNKSGFESFYSSGIGQPTGIFTVNLTDDGKIGNFKSYDFSVEMLNKNASRKEKKKTKKKAKKNEKDENEKPSFEDLSINSIAINSDGSFLILGEQDYLEFSTHMSGGASGMSTSTTTYYYRNMLAAKINADGSLAWIHKLAKHQSGVRGKSTMSYTHMFAGDSHYLLYLDNIKNLNLPDDEYPKHYRDRHEGYLTAYIINDKTGAIKKEAIFNVKDINGVEMEHFDTDKILSLSNSEILIEGFEGRSKDFLVKVTAKKNN
ncbi:MAG: hypothetical protein QM478_06835 [Flavobacteriaceae bacterium]